MRTLLGGVLIVPSGLGRRSIRLGTRKKLATAPFVFRTCIGQVVLLYATIIFVVRVRFILVSSAPLLLCATLEKSVQNVR